MPKHDDLDDLFEVEPNGANLIDDDDGTDTSAGDSSMSFEDTLADMHASVQPIDNGGKKSNKQIIIESARQAEEEAITPDSVARDIKELNDSVTKEEQHILGIIKGNEQTESSERPQETAETVKGSSTCTEDGQTTVPLRKQKTTAEVKSKHSDTMFDEDPGKDETSNPLGLSLTELEDFRQIQKDYPQFNFDTSDSLMRTFYRYKARQLISLLGRFPILDTRSIQEELKDVNINQFTGSQQVSADTVASFMADVLVARQRVTTIFLDITAQIYLWQKSKSMLEGKLFLERDIRGEHKRQGIMLEHMPDVENYCEGLHAAHESAKRVDALLIAAHDTLSRQLACIQFEGNMITLKKTRSPTTAMTDKSLKGKASNRLDGLDEISDGTRITDKPARPTMETNSQEVNWDTEFN